MFKSGLIHTKYILNLETSKGFYTIEYCRATIADYIEYAVTTENRLIWIYKFLESHITKTKSKRMFRKAIFSKAEFLSLDMEDVNVIMEKINETRFFVPKMRVQADDGFNPPFESYIAFLSGKLSVAPHTLLNEYTLEQAILLSR